MTPADTLLSLPRRLNSLLDRWLTQPEDHAAGRLGLYRIVFSLFYLWRLSGSNLTDLGHASTVGWKPIFVDRFLTGAPPAGFFEIALFGLVFSLVLLLIGYHVRLMTTLVLVLGVTIEVFRFSFGKVDHDTLFLVFYVPLFMSLSRWGDTYSLDAHLKTRRGQPKVEPSASSWRFAWPMRATLLMLSMLFASAAYWKLTHGSWSQNPMTLANLLLTVNVGAAAGGDTPQFLRVLPAQIPTLSGMMQAGMLAFESLFFLSLFNRSVRNWFVSLAVIFHAFNLLLMNVTFAPQLAAYLLFVDWQAVYSRWIPERVRPARLNRLTPRSAVGIALTVALLWVLTPLARPIFQLGGLLTPTTLWYWALPFGVIAFGRSSVVLVHALRSHVQAPKSETAV